MRTGHLPKPHRFALAIAGSFALLTVTACGSQTPAITTVPPTSPSSPAPTKSTPPTPEPSPTSSGPTTTPAPEPREPIDVSEYESAEFASPSGAIICGMNSTAAFCFLPPGFQGKTPSGEKACGEDWMEVNGVWVGKGKPGWACYNDPVAWPTKGSSGVVWHEDTNFGFVKRGGQEFAVLPYGESLRHGKYLCSSNTDGVRCENAAGHGFKLRKAGVKFF